MDIKSVDILNKRIISKKEGVELAIAKELFFDTKNKKVVAILTDTSGGLENAKGVLLKKVKSIGETIMVETKEDLVPASDIVKPEKDEAGNNQTLVGSTQITEDGQDLGQILDVTFDSKSGQIKAATSNDEGEKKTSKIDKVVTVSPTTTVVKGKEKEKDKNKKGPLEQLKGML
jgi:uncharacterized protein YrrD